MFLGINLRIILHLNRLPEDNYGDHVGMENYRILSMDSPTDGKVTDPGVALHVKDVPCAERHMWSPDNAFFVTPH